MEDALISVQEMDFYYQSDRPVLSIEQFHLKSREKVFLYGPSGSGKTTFLNLSAGVLKPKTGSMKLFGQEVASLSSRSLDRLRGLHMGYVFQSFNLISYLSVIDNIMLPTKLFPKGKTKTEHLERAMSYLKRLNLETFAHSPARKLSIGQQQRVAIARAFMATPDLLIADEPTSSLDEDNTEGFMELLIEEVEKKEMGLLFVSHDRRLEKYFDRSLDLRQLNQVKSKGSP